MLSRIVPYIRWHRRCLSSKASTHLNSDLAKSVFSQFITPSSNKYQQLHPKPEDEIVIAMSSGVDSSVCAALYASVFPNVRGIYMANWTQTSRCIEADWKDVQTVCKQLEIPVERVNFEKEYWHKVFVPMLDEYRKGWTPNPDVGCNQHVKFGVLYDHVMNQDQCQQTRRWLVTGHYSRVMKHLDSNEFHLLRGLYLAKDQAYYLAKMPVQVMDHVLMPMGHLTKPKVRELASKFGLSTALKPDLDGLCFVQQDTKFRDFLAEYLEPNPGNIVTEDGKIWGQHEGLWHATIGQKSGILMPQGDDKYKGTWFVSEKNLADNLLVIVRGNKNDKLYKNQLVVENWQWFGSLSPLELQLNGDQWTQVKDLNVQFRSLQHKSYVDCLKLQRGDDDSVLSIKLMEKERAMAPGQTLVLYLNDRIIGSGIIRETQSN
ncbi:uncharacterized protein KQ657_003473 [Scheffersomyces spartinae]|uniref:tRNA-5-taurinomethyluridine 2-sulfurtransferase n=1 Tax=Scheffersomyces spartinae TaxID=45513 RepID=A0A9P8AGU3_9ASCO|nr:uncharacterized protein KQ657_003473 [Scheffersomyces spartinae]KAG7191427.1 hypothetical protein KQ657_003473 [Scheffersomyces spartinae]